MVGGADGLVLVIYHPVPDTGSSENLALLASLSAPAPSSITIDATDT
jgi:hypothetical protein